MIQRNLWLIQNRLRENIGIIIRQYNLVIHFQWGKVKLIGLYIRIQFFFKERYHHLGTGKEYLIIAGHKQSVRVQCRHRKTILFIIVIKALVLHIKTWKALITGYQEIAGQRLFYIKDIIIDQVRIVWVKRFEWIVIRLI